MFFTSPGFSRRDSNGITRGLMNLAMPPPPFHINLIHNLKDVEIDISKKTYFMDGH